MNALIRRDENQSAIALSEVMSLGEVFTQSGYFSDAKSQAQAVVKILYGQELGISPVQSMMGIHIINGKPAPSGGLIATLIKKSRRYNYRIAESTNTRCAIEFFEEGQSLGQVDFTLEDAKKAGLLDGPNRHNWSKYPADMLFNRCIARGARRHCADVFGGPVYVEEELQSDHTVYQSSSNIVPIPKRASESPQAIEAEVIEEDTPALCDHDTAMAIVSLWPQHGQKDKAGQLIPLSTFVEGLAKKKQLAPAKSVRELPQENAQQLLEWLQARELAVAVDRNDPAYACSAANWESLNAAIARLESLGVTEDQWKAEVAALFDSPLTALTDPQVGEVIDLLNAWAESKEKKQQ